jgi:hypothetical protein
MKNIHERLNIPYKEIDFEDISLIGENGAIILSQEGIKDFLKGLWEKIKEFIFKIVNGVKNFFKSYFTSKGIAYRKLKNIEEVLTEKSYVMDKGVATSDKVPSGIKSRFKTEHDHLAPNIILDIIHNANPQFLKEFINVSYNFLTKSAVKTELKNAIIKLKEAQVRLEAAKADKKGFAGNVKEGIKKDGLIKGGFTGAGNYFKESRNISNIEKEISESKKEVEKHINEKDINDIANEENEIQDKKLNELLDKYKTEFNTVAKEILKNREIYFANGKILKISEDDNEDGFIVFRTDVAENIESPKTVIYAEQKTLLTIIKAMTNALTEADHISDQLNKFVSATDNILKELDELYKILSTTIKDYPENSPMAKSMNAMNKKINVVLKPFTKSLKNAISQTFKLSTNILDNAVNVAHGVIAYAVESMKLYHYIS